MSRATQWTYNMVCFSTFFTAMKKSIDLKLQQKRYTKAYHIICSLCRSTHLESNTIWFSILWFFCDLLWFFKTDLGGNLTGFGKFRGWYRRFHSLGGYVDQPHSWGGDIDFFLSNLYSNKVQQSTETRYSKVHEGWTRGRRTTGRIKFVL